MIAKVANHRLPAARRGGFTLLEVLVVTAILVILAGLATFATVSYLDNARIREAQLKMQKIEQAAKAFHTMNEGNWPESLNDLVAPADGRPLLEGGQTAIMDPWGKPFSYNVQPDQFGATRVVIQTTDDKGNPLQWPKQ